MSRTSVGRKRSTIIVVLVALFTVAGLGTAFAFWTSTGSGAGLATAGASEVFTITSEAPVGVIAPGSAGQTVNFTVTNPAAGTQNLSNIAVTMADADGTAWVPPTGCLIDDFTAVISTAPVYGPIAPNGTLTGTATVTLANTTANQDACQGVTVHLYFVAS